MKNIKFFKKYFESIVNLDFVEKLKKFNEKEIKIVIFNFSAKKPPQIN